MTQRNPLTDLDPATDGPPSSDAEWEAWGEAWRREPAVGGADMPRSPAGGALDAPSLGAAERTRLRRRAERFGLGLRIVTVLELVLGFGLLSWLGAIAWREPTGSNLLLLIITLVLVVVGESMVLWNRRGTWGPEAPTTAGFVELGILRARRKLRTIQLMLPFVALELGLILPWKWWQMSTSERWGDQMPGAFLPLLGIVVAVLAVSWLGLWWWRRRVERELEEYRLLQRALADDGAG
ncbi:MAG: hypothetical protein AAGD06_05970 [Acidobacteriota bacterium]